MREIKFRAWDKRNKKMVCTSELAKEGLSLSIDLVGDLYDVAYDRIDDGVCNDYFELMQYTGLHDKNGKECYVGDICRFSNGDTFYFDMEEWLFLTCNWIGEPECEDQMRDLYRVYAAEIIGNIYENPEHMK